MAKKKNSSSRKAVKETAKAVKRMSAAQKVGFFIAAVIVVVALVFVYIYVVKPIIDKGERNPGGETFQPTEKAEGDLRIHFIDVGQGDCIFIELPDGKYMIIDGGDDKRKTETHMVEYISALEVTYIDYMLLTHTDSDHVGGLDKILESFAVGTIFMPEITTDQITTIVYKTFMDLVDVEMANETDKAVINYTTDDDDIDGGSYLLDFYDMEHLYSEIKQSSIAEKKNAVSPLLFLTYAEKKVLFTGDANEITEEYFLLRSDITLSNYDVDVLKVGHHGSATSSTAAFLAAVKPEYAVFQCGADNNHKHPRQAALDRIMEYTGDKNLYRTDTNGDIVLTIGDDGSLAFEVTTVVDASVNTVGGDTAAAQASLILDGIYLFSGKFTITGEVLDWAYLTA